jgi:hypothetical protein
MLGGRGVALLCEELVLRARVDLDQRRFAHAAIELRGAYAAALAELPGEQREDLAIRIDELRKLRAGVEQQARLVLGEQVADRADVDAAEEIAIDGGGSLERASEDGVDEPVVRHALERLEATLRARTATGFRLKR